MFNCLRKRLLAAPHKPELDLDTLREMRDPRKRRSVISSNGKKENQDLFCSRPAFSAARKNSLEQGSPCSSRSAVSKVYQCRRLVKTIHWQALIALFDFPRLDIARVAGTLLVFIRTIVVARAETGTTSELENE